MPIYEYQCEKCSNIDELLMSLSDPAPTHCSKCQGPVHKKLSNTSFALKGSGWYATDYKKSSPSPAVTTNAEAAPTSTPSGGGCAAGGCGTGGCSN